jgi:SWI/SNF-related matrix-associated actin-dependent regulator 1 of chromatin subfamily A
MTMDSIAETPVKRRKTEQGHVEISQGYDSADDDGDEIFDDYETIETMPLPKAIDIGKPTTPPKTIAQSSELRSYPLPYDTQPTQLLDEAPVPPTPNRTTIQVAASSPAPHVLSSPVPSKPKPRNLLFPHSLAPPGTAFRSPTAVQLQPAKAKEVIELSDEEEDRVRFVGGSSDDEHQGLRKDIPPSVVTSRQRTTLANRNGANATSSVDTQSRFKSLTSGYLYDGSKPKDDSTSLTGSLYDSRNRDEEQTVSRISVTKRTADTMASSYGGTDRRDRPTKHQRQTGPAKALAVPPEMKLEDIADFETRRKVTNIQKILPNEHVLDIYNAILNAKRTDDAMDLLMRRQEERERQAALDSDPVVINTDDDEAVPDLPPVPKKSSTKQKAKTTHKSLAEKYSTATQGTPSQPTQAKSVSVEKNVPKRKLMRGRQAPSSPQQLPSSSPIVKSRARAISIDSEDDADSGIAPSASEAEAKFDGGLVDFLNTCSEKDLVDIANLTESVATIVLSKRPFKTVKHIRLIDGDLVGAKGKKKSSVRRPIGEKVVEACEKMLTAYAAVNELVNHCRRVADPVAREMKKWGVDVYGTDKGGELEMVNLDGSSDPKSRDSGIGTPASTSASADEDPADAQVKLTKRSKFFPQPAIVQGKLHDYQVVGINWLSLLYNNNLSCILADDMGLGKTCQVIAFLAHLHEQGEEGIHLLVVPASVVENWLREFERFCPTMSIMPYHASKAERPALQEQIKENRPNVVITTYTLAKNPEDRKFLRKLRPTVCVFDEAHALKNATSKVYGELMKIRCRFRLMLTGTPIQNNLGELLALLGFLLPDVFEEHTDALQAIFDRRATTNDSTHTALLSEQRTSRARSMMTPFILRRKKHQVIELPAKIKRTVYCHMTTWQQKVYQLEWERNKAAVSGRQAKDKSAEKPYNVMMALRKAAIHPMLHRHSYSDGKCREMARAYMASSDSGDINEDLVLEDLLAQSDFSMQTQCEMYPSITRFALPGEPWLDSGKIETLVDLLVKYKAGGDRVLIFSQMTMVLDIIERVLETISIRFCRLDGTTKVQERQPDIDLFNNDPSITAFMLSTKAGGAGINLASANKVIIFDSGFNPQDDIQAENRAHRVGQTREVEVIRLVTKGSIEEAIYALGETKLELDKKVAQEEEETMAKEAEKIGMKEVERVMREQMEGGKDEQ